MTRLAEGLRRLGEVPVGVRRQPDGLHLRPEPHPEELLREDLFTVVMEQFPTDTVDYADIVLPATMQIEHTDLHAGYGHMYLMWNEPAVDAAGRVPVHHGDVPPPGRAHGADRAVAVRLRPGAGRAAARPRGHPVADGHHGRPAAQGGLGPAELPQPFVPFADGFPTPSGRLAFGSRARRTSPLTRRRPARGRTR